MYAHRLEHEVANAEQKGLPVETAEAVVGVVDAAALVLVLLLTVDDEVLLVLLDLIDEVLDVDVGLLLVVEVVEGAEGRQNSRLLNVGLAEDAVLKTLT